MKRTIIAATAIVLTGWAIIFATDADAATGVVSVVPPRATAFQTCATVNNITNSASWRTGNGPVQFAEYRGDDPAVWNRRVPRAVLVAYGKLSVGAAGPKTKYACTTVYVKTTGRGMALNPQDAAFRMAASRDEQAINQLVQLIVRLAARLPEREQAAVANQLGNILPIR